MRFNLISNIDNGFGLQKDFEILKSLLESLGHDVCGVHFQKPNQAESVDVNIYLETLIDLLLDACFRDHIRPVSVLLELKDFMSKILECPVELPLCAIADSVIP